MNNKYTNWYISDEVRYKAELSEAEAKDLGAKKDAPGTLMGRDGRLYDVQKAGWVTPRAITGVIL